MLKARALIVVLLSDSEVLRVQNTSVGEFIDNLINGLLGSEAKKRNQTIGHVGMCL